MPIAALASSCPRSSEEMMWLQHDHILPHQAMAVGDKYWQPQLYEHVLRSPTQIQHGTHAGI